MAASVEFALATLVLQLAAVPYPMSILPTVETLVVPGHRSLAFPFFLLSQDRVLMSSLVPSPGLNSADLI